MFRKKKLASGRGILEREEKLYSFDIAPSVKNEQSRSDAGAEFDSAFLWTRMPVSLTALHGTKAKNRDYFRCNIRSLSHENTHSSRIFPHTEQSNSHPHVGGVLN